MQAIIMAAGKGSRLGNLTADKPKSFLEINDIKLIEYNIALLHSFNIKNIIIVTGYMTEKMEELTSNIEGIKCIYNPFYEMVNVLGSFFMAQEYLTEDTIYMHADTLCAPEIMDKMICTEGDMVLPVEYKVCDEEAMKVITKNGKVTKISKLIDCKQAEGEFIGIAKISKNIIPSLKKASKNVLMRKEFTSYFEGAIQEMINTCNTNIVTIDTQNYFWGEIDFWEDYQRAEEQISDQLVQIAKECKKAGAN